MIVIIPRFIPPPPSLPPIPCFIPPPPSVPEKRTNTIIPSLRSEARVKASADWTGFTEVRSECNHKGNFDETTYEYLITG